MPTPSTVRVSTTTLQWRRFREEYVHEALVWARDGGIAIIESDPGSNKEVIRMIGPDNRTLCSAAKQLGLQKSTIQRKPTLPALNHFVVNGMALLKALARCDQSAATVRYP